MNKGLLVLLLFVKGLLLASQDYYLVACAVFQNESFFLKEWIEFHKLVGVEHFYLYNNGSKDNYLEILQPYLESGLIELYEWPCEANNQQEYLEFIQLPIYNEALAKAKLSTKWAAFIDLDEFLFPVEDNSLKELLKGFESYAGLAVNWQVYGTSWKKDIPKGNLIIEELVLKAPQNTLINSTVKLIVQPVCVEAIHNPHSFTFKNGSFPVNSDKTPIEIDCGSNFVKIDKIRINHYWFGTEHFFFNEKKPRREKWGFEFNHISCRSFMERCNAVYDDSIYRFACTLKECIDVK